MPVAAPRLYLASGSPRRRELLANAGYRFELRPAPVTESASAQLTPVELVRLNARRKARAGVVQLGVNAPPGVVLGADTLVALENTALGKPRDMSEAFRMISRLAGRSHDVLTGVCLIPVTGSSLPVREWVERTTVTFRALDPGAIRAYLTRIDPLDKAGAYAAQEHGADIIAATRGSWTNIMGLPMESLQQELAAFNVAPNL